MSESRIELLDGKYTVIHNNGVGFRALRHGEPWRILTGDGLLFAMTQEIERLRSVETDRDIKAANLKTLVDMVLGYDAACVRAIENSGDGGDIADCTDMYKGLLELARGLKQ